MQYKQNRWIKMFIGVILVCSGCATIASLDLNRLYGEENTQNRTHAMTAQSSPESAATVFYESEVEPVINARCVVCHACYDAPCQLKMTHPEGIERGANKEKVYHGSRLIAATPNRLFIDGQNSTEWRERGFYPVLNEREQSATANTQASVLAKMLTLKQENPLPDDKLLDERFDVSIDRSQQCPTVQEFEGYAQSQAFGGMPYALPELSNEEHNTLMKWIEAGAYMPSAPTISAAEQQAVEKLEAFLNGDSLKVQLSARYIYEHLFSTHLYFSELSESNVQPQFFNIVRSRTPSGEPIEIIASRRPFDDPKVERVYYRLFPVTSTIVNKTHQPYAIHKALTDKWQKWFVDDDYTVTEMPSYQPQVAANPLTAFAQLPVNARYRFMLERAQNTIMGYIKGPVCRGQVALNVINDRFWVYFVKPEVAASAEINAFYDTQKNNLRLPAEKESTAFAVTWIEYASRQGDYMRARQSFMNTELKKGYHFNPEDIWDGDGENKNATLTVFRHFDNATVIKGLVGKPPKTAWIIDYALLERIHYLLVAGFDVYGNYGHQLMTRLYMDFLRMEGETNFLAFLPPDSRRKELAAWYQKSGPELTSFFEGNVHIFDQPSGIEYKTKNHKKELFGIFAKHLEKVQPQRYNLNNSKLATNSQALLAQLGNIKGTGASILPELTMIMVEPADGKTEEIFTLVRNSAHFNVNSLFSENDNRDLKNDNVTLVHGLLGSYPDAFWRVKESHLASMVALAQQIETEQDYTTFLDTFAVRRTSKDFWQFSDRLNQLFMQDNPVEAGWLDYNRLENR
ncbi:fatty acid cis/trans isomerase [Aliiglaciecola sp. 3_MG-2023]|uniref:fatty acid cis/trans isomerase n=1 Tax=Aliiglaciecola sp. 3_MG-2023 TaxID=3062644 RepID=UPI0026E2C858|nr:fatty acid cis/trans isomerase [Aliiglaciecola sp. 3_MG-2023]MDO6695219.1 fatty acid cis/trans isomerase [Aliiglaciecola sp. 3_MG-2023]